MEALPIDLLVQAGAVGIALALIALIYFGLRTNAKERGQFNEIISRHLEKSDNTIEKNATAMTKLASVIESNTKATDRNSVIMSRVENKLDRG